MRDVWISARLTKEERETVRRNLAAAGYRSLGQYLRENFIQSISSKSKLSRWYTPNERMEMQVQLIDSLSNFARCLENGIDESLVRTALEEVREAIKRLR